MNIEGLTRYKTILLSQVEEGMDILAKLNVASKTYQQVVVNINNANNIVYQLETELVRQIEEKEHPKTTIEPITTTAKDVIEKKPTETAV